MKKKQETIFSAEQEEEQQIVVNSKSLLVHFCGIGNSYFELFLYDGDKLVQRRHIPLYDGDSDLSTMSEQAIADMIGEYFTDFGTMYLLLTDKTIRKNTLAYPRLRKVKVEKLYKDEIKPEELKFGDKYRSFSECYQHSLGYIYYTYFVPEAIITLFSKAAILMNCTFGGWDLFARYVIKLFPHEKKEPLLVYFEEYGNSNMVLSYNGVLSTSTTYRTNPDECKRQYLCVISKHFFELEKKEAKEIRVCAPANVPFFGKYAKPVEKLSFDTFVRQGIRL